MISLSLDDLRDALRQLGDDAKKQANMIQGDAKVTPLELAESLVGVAGLRQRLGKLTGRLQRQLTQREIPLPSTEAR